MQESYIDQEGGGFFYNPNRTWGSFFGRQAPGQGYSYDNSRDSDYRPTFNTIEINNDPNSKTYQQKIIKPHNPTNNDYDIAYKKHFGASIAEADVNITNHRLISKEDTVINEIMAYLNELDVSFIFSEEEIQKTNMAYIEMYHIFSRIFSTLELELELEIIYSRIVFLLIYNTNYKDNMNRDATDEDLENIREKHFENNKIGFQACFGFIYLYIHKYANIPSSTSNTITDIEGYINNMNKNNPFALQWCYDYISSNSEPLTNEKKTKPIEFNIKSLNSEATSGCSIVLFLNRNTAKVLQRIPWENDKGVKININMVILIYDQPVLTPKSQQILSYYLTKCDTPSATTSKENNVERAAAVVSGKNSTDENPDADQVNLPPPPPSGVEKAALSELSNNNRDFLQSFSGSGGAADINSQKGSSVGTKAGPNPDEIEHLVDDLLEDGNQTTNPFVYCFFNYVNRRKTRSYKDKTVDDYKVCLETLFPDGNTESDDKKTLKQIYHHINYIKELHDHIDEKLIILYIHTFINFSITRDIKKDILNDDMDKNRFDELVGEIYCNNSSDEMNNSSDKMGGGIWDLQNLVPPLPIVSTISSLIWEKIVVSGDFLISNLTVKSAAATAVAALAVAATLGAWRVKNYKSQETRIKTIIEPYREKEDREKEDREKEDMDYKYSLFRYKER
jgi:hypothetical protein